VTVPKLYAALDVSLNKTAVCIMDHDGRIVREVEVVTCPDAVADVLGAYHDQLERVGLEAGPMSEWLIRGLLNHSIDAVLMETRQAHKALSAMTVKTDRNDARGLHLLRMGWFAPGNFGPGGAIRDCSAGNRKRAFPLQGSSSQFCA